MKRLDYRQTNDKRVRAELRKPWKDRTPMTLLDALSWLEVHHLARLTDAQCAQVMRAGTLMLAAADGVEPVVLFGTIMSLARHALQANTRRARPRKPNQRRRRG